MKKNILLIGYNFNPEPTGIGKYSGEMISWLAEKGYNCTVITTYPYYPYWKVQEPYYKNRFWYKSESQKFTSGGSIKVYRCPIYVPSKPSGIKRIMLDLSFLVSASLQMMLLILRKQFDFVITVVPSFQFGLLGILYKMFRNAKFLYHIQDMQIEAARDLNLIRSEKVIKRLLKIENFIFKKADGISTISEGMAGKVKEKSQKEIYLLANWVNTDLFKPLNDKPSLKKDFGYSPYDKIVLYSGAIGEKQGLEQIINAAKKFEGIEHLKFIICGSGPYKEKLLKVRNNLGLENLKFLPLQPLNTFNKLLNMVDVHLVIQKSQATDLVMPSKLSTILAVGGLALVTANPGSELYRIIQSKNMGLLVDADNQEALNEGILKATGEDWQTLSTNARNYAESNLSIDSILTSYEKLVLTV